MRRAAPSVDAPRSAPEARRWVALCLALVGLGALALGLAGAARCLQGDLARVIEERGLEPDALFYTETEETAEAFNYFSNSAIAAPRSQQRREPDAENPRSW